MEKIFLDDHFLSVVSVERVPLENIADPTRFVRDVISERVVRGSQILFDKPVPGFQNEILPPPVVVLFKNSPDDVRVIAFDGYIFRKEEYNERYGVQSYSKTKDIAAKVRERFEKNRIQETLSSLEALTGRIISDWTLRTTLCEGEDFLKEDPLIDGVHCLLGIKKEKTMDSQYKNVTVMLCTTRIERIGSDIEIHYNYGSITEPVIDALAPLAHIRYKGSGYMHAVWHTLRSVMPPRAKRTA